MSDLVAFQGTSSGLGSESHSSSCCYKVYQKVGHLELIWIVGMNHQEFLEDRNEWSPAHLQPNINVTSTHIFPLQTQSNVCLLFLAQASSRIVIHLPAELYFVLISPLQFDL